MGKKSKRRATNDSPRGPEAIAASYNYYGLTKQEWEGGAKLRYQINEYINNSKAPVRFLWDLWSPHTDLGSALGVTIGGQFFAANIDERFLGLLVASAVHVYRTFASGGQLDEGRRLYTRYIVGIILHVEAYLQVGREAFFDGFEVSKMAKSGKPQWRQDLIDDKYDKLQSMEQLVEFLGSKNGGAGLGESNN